MHNFFAKIGIILDVCKSFSKDMVNINDDTLRHAKFQLQAQNDLLILKGNKHLILRCILINTLFFLLNKK